MNTEIEQILEKRFKELPENVVGAIRSIPWLEAMQNIVSSEKLEGKQKESFELETALVVLGIESPLKYPENLSREAGIDDDKVVALAKKVDEQIIQPIQEALKKLPGTTSKTSLPAEKISSFQATPVPSPTVTVAGATSPVLPAVEAGESAHETTPAEKAFMNAPIPTPVARIMPAEPAKTPEPIPVPAIPLPAEPAAPIASKSIVEEKLRNMTVATAPAAAAPASTPAAPAAPAYQPGKDPYREPIE